MTGLLCLFKQQVLFPVFFGGIGLASIRAAIVDVDLTFSE